MAIFIRLLACFSSQIALARRDLADLLKVTQVRDPGSSGQRRARFPIGVSSRDIPIDDTIGTLKLDD